MFLYMTSYIHDVKSNAECLLRSFIHFTCLKVLVVVSMIVSRPLAIPWLLFFESVEQSEAVLVSELKPSLSYRISPTTGFIMSDNKRVTD